ncbi:hypothetical protein ACQR1W_01770 [Bradyrhizobium sp. HKCCYLS1011]|uniref:hypothetical protein n=1 Tax=Bradyrhizobium sp. HKCCYLS1011 TaxID=3420733 RepID=UPI003EBA7974
MAHADQGIVKTGRAEEQPVDKDRAQRATKTDSSQAVSREATRHPETDGKDDDRVGGSHEHSK